MIYALLAEFRLCLVVKDLDAVDIITLSVTILQVHYTGSRKCLPFYRHQRPEPRFMAIYVTWIVILYNLEKFNENNGTKVLLTHLKEIVESAI